MNNQPNMPAKREPLFFAVIVLLIADILAGLGLAVFAETVLGFRPMAILGVGVAILGLGILAYFILLGGGSDHAARQKKRSKAALSAARLDPERTDPALINPAQISPVLINPVRPPES